jgi:VPDSG-CTERM motif
LFGIGCAYVYDNENNRSFDGTRRPSVKPTQTQVNHMKKLFTLLAVLGGMALASGAYANSLTLVNDVVPVTGSFDWSYHVDWSNSQLQTGDFVHLTGLAGVTTAAGPAGWNAVVSGGGSVVTWTWAGASPFNLVGTTGTITGFTFHSTFGIGTSAPYNTQDHVNSGLGAGGVSTVTGFVSAPTPPAVPDGGSAVTLLGIAIAGIEGARRLLARKA